MITVWCQTSKRKGRTILMTSEPVVGRCAVHRGGERARRVLFSSIKHHVCFSQTREGQRNTEERGCLRWKFDHGEERVREGERERGKGGSRILGSELKDRNEE